MDIEETQFKNVRETVDNTTGVNGSFASSYLNAAEGKTVGPFREFEVEAGDIINMKAWSRYIYDNTKSKTTYSSTNDILGNSGEGFGNGISFGVNPFSPNSLGNLPNAYLRLEVYDSEGNLQASQRKVQYVSGGVSNWFQLTLSDTLNQDGFVKVFVANESDMDVWFDDVSITHQQGLIVQENHYYPYGLNLAGIEKKGTPDHKFQYNGKEKEDFKFSDGSSLNWMDYGARMYDAQLGRWHVVDAMAEKVPTLTPYRYAFNNPINVIDPDGNFEYVKGGYGEDIAVDGTMSHSGAFYNADGSIYTGIEATVTVKVNADKDANSRPDDNVILINGKEVAREETDDKFDIIFNFADFSELGGPGLGLASVDIKEKVEFRDLLAKGNIEFDAATQFAIGELALLGIKLAGFGLKGIKGMVTKGSSQGFESFSAFKRAFGSAGPGKAWHHIVEQGGDNVAKFGANRIHNTSNLIKLPHGKGSIHSKISGYYSSKQAFTGGKTVRQWLSTQSYKDQYNFGIKTLKQFGWKP